MGPVVGVLRLEEVDGAVAVLVDESGHTFAVDFVHRRDVDPSVADPVSRSSTTRPMDD